MTHIDSDFGIPHVYNTVFKTVVSRYSDLLLMEDTMVLTWALLDSSSKCTISYVILSSVYMRHLWHWADWIWVHSCTIIALSRLQLRTRVIGGILHHPPHLTCVGPRSTQKYRYKHYWWPDKALHNFHLTGMALPQQKKCMWWHGKP